MNKVANPVYLVRSSTVTKQKHLVPIEKEGYGTALDPHFTLIWIPL